LLLLRERQLQNADGCLWVFANPSTGQPYSCISHTWNRARERAGMPDLRLHDLRHSFASFLINNGRSLYEVQKILGHSTQRMTERYAHLAHDTLLDATNAVGVTLEGRWNTL
jgi:integrase